jgi:integrase
MASTSTLKADRIPGLYIRTMKATGAKSYLVVARDKNGKQKWKSLGSVKSMTLDEARKKAGARIDNMKAGLAPEGKPTFDKVADDWLKLYVDEKRLRSAIEVRRMIKNHLREPWGGRDFESIRRGDVTEVLDHVKARSGSRTAVYVLAIVSKLCNWYASRNENYVSPIIKGMRENYYSAKEHARERILNDDEIRELWTASGEFGNFTKLLLLTGQRCAKVNGMRWDEIEDGTWHVPKPERGEKGNGGSLNLPQVALDIINSQPRFVSDPHVFRIRRHLTPSGKTWVLHDLRRTARSLMSRAGVQPHIAERVLGHVQPGVAGVYDRHTYDTDKAHALSALAGLLANILNPTDNVVPLRA